MRFYAFGKRLEIVEMEIGISVEWRRLGVDDAQLCAAFVGDGGHRRRRLDDERTPQDDEETTRFRFADTRR